MEDRVMTKHRTKLERFKTAPTPNWGGVALVFVVGLDLNAWDAHFYIISGDEQTQIVGDPRCACP